MAQLKNELIEIGQKKMGDGQGPSILDGRKMK